jgi:hypothetical protein
MPVMSVEDLLREPAPQVLGARGGQDHVAPALDDVEHGLMWKGALQPILQNLKTVVETG